MRPVNQTKAFTLIEMALILILFGVILSATLPKLLSEIKTDAAKRSKNMVAEARDELAGYALAKGVLPTADTSGALPAVPSSIKARIDGWNQPLTYVLPNVNATGGTLDTISICDFAATDLAVTRGGTTTYDVAFLVASRGENQLNGLAGIGTTEVTVGAFGSADPVNANREFDDIAEFVTLEYLQNKIGCSSGNDPYEKGDVSFKDDFSDFPTITSGGYPSAGPGSGGITVTAGNDGFEMDGVGNRNSACIWYLGNAASGNCGSSAGETPARASGACTMGNGFRAYFEYQSMSPATETGGGHTFAIVGVNATHPTDTRNTNTNTMCGEARGWSAGYAGNESGLVIEPPKIAVEFDYNRHASSNDPNNSSGGDQQDNHIALLFYGVDGASGASADDDTEHGAGNWSGNNSLNPSAATSSNADGAYFETGADWLEGSGATRGFRMELDNDPANHTIVIRIWHDCSTNVHCNNLTDDLANFPSTPPVPDITYPDSGTLDFPPAGLEDYWDIYHYGWTFGQGNISYDIQIRNFSIQFK